MPSGQATKERKTTKVSKANKKTKDEQEIVQPAGHSEQSKERANEQAGVDTNTRVMGERQEASQNEEETDAERIERRTSSVDSGEDDYAEDTDEAGENEDKDNLHKDADTYDGEDQAEGEDYDEDKEHVESR